MLFCVVVSAHILIYKHDRSHTHTHQILVKTSETNNSFTSSLTYAHTHTRIAISQNSSLGKHPKCTNTLCANNGTLIVSHTLALHTHTHKRAAPPPHLLIRQCMLIRATTAFQSIEFTQPRFITKIYILLSYDHFGFSLDENSPL